MFSGSYQTVVELVVIRIRVRVASQLSNFLFHFLLHHPRYRAFRLRAIVPSLTENFTNVLLSQRGIITTTLLQRYTCEIHLTAILSRYEYKSR